MASTVHSPTLAILGGPPVRPQGPPAWPIDDPDVRAALLSAVADGSWGKYHGPHVPRLEAELARFHGVEFAATCASGTFAVELALRALRIGPGDEVILAGYDFGGNYFAILAVGATPVLIDLEPSSWTLDPEQIARAVGPATRALIVSHLHGAAAPMRRIVAAAAEHGIHVVEDAAQMPGALVEGRRAGAWGDVGVLSFGGSKLLSAGRGGAILTASRAVQHRARLACQRGNHAFPLSELQAAVLLPQLAKLDARNLLRAESVRNLATALAEIPGLRLPACRLPETRPAYYKLGIQYDAQAWDGLDRARLLQALRAEGIALDAGFRGFQDKSSRRCRIVGELSETRRAAARMLVLHHPVLLSGAAAVAEIGRAFRKLYDARAALLERHEGGLE